MIFFFYGPNSFELRHQVNQMVEKYLAKTGSDLEYERIDGSTTKLEMLRASLTASPFLASSRLIVVEDISLNKAISDKLQTILDVVPSTTVVIFIETAIDQRTSVFKALSKVDKVLKFEPLARPDLMAWAERQIKKQGGSIERRALGELIDRIGDNQWRLNGEIGKLVNYEAKITSESVDTLVTPGFEQNIFTLVESMTSGRADVALEVYRGLIGQREEPLKVLTMIEWQLRNLLLAKTAGNIPQAELAKEAGMSPYVAGKMISAQRRFEKRVLEAAFKAAVDCEYDIKSGKYKGEVAVEQLIYRIAAVTKG